jgi:site-specific DNA-methyltransferase (cytosine-N4-specific)
MIRPYYSDPHGKLYWGDSLKIINELPENSIDMIITSPPYWNLRDYHEEGQLGQEPTFNEFVVNLATYFYCAKRILKDNGTLWVNLGDTYYSKNKGSGGKSKKQLSNSGSFFNNSKIDGNELPEKSLCLIPSRFAIEMQTKDWILRNDIIWHKPNQMPTSAKDRFTLDYEHLFFFTKKNKDYYFEQQLEPAKYAGDNRGSRTDNRDKEGLGRTHGTTGEFKNMRSIWSINTQPVQGMNHFAKFPEKLIETPIKAGCPEGGVVLDIFFGSGTTGVVCEKLNRKWMGIELNREYCNESIERIKNGRSKR